MWNHRKMTFLAYQLATAVVCWTLYRNTSPAWLPAVVFFLSMQASAVLGTLHARRARGKTPVRTSILVN